MRRLVLHGVGDLRVEEAPLPVPGPGEVRLSVSAVGVCGSDVHGYRGANTRRRPGTVMGHEVSGIVDAVGPGTDAGLVGAAVAVNPVVGCEHCADCAAGRPQRCATKELIGCVPSRPGGFADAVVVPAGSVYRLRGGVDVRFGAFAEPLATGVHAVAGRVGSGLRVLVIGSGAVGLSASWAAAADGADVCVLDRDGHRAPLAEELGVRPVARAEAMAVAADLVVDCVASDESLDLAVAAGRVGGTIVVVGLGAPWAQVCVERLVQDERSLVGSAQYTPRDFAAAVDAISTGRFSAAAVLREPEELWSAPAIFRRWGDVDDPPLRVLLAP
jgi:threonine dehydrogenase-like Zn-dependent dehydrogenase